MLVGCENADNEEDIQWLSKKICGLRVFDDENGVMNKSIMDVGGDILVVSQFTLWASYKKGNRPSYLRAGSHEVTIPLYERFCAVLSENLGHTVSTGEFGADMKVELLNDGPVTICMDTKNKESQITKITIQTEENKYFKVLSQYDCDIDDEKVKRQVDILLKEHLQENNTIEVKKFLLNSVELTTLKTTDSEDSVLKFVEKVNKFDDEYPELGHVATVCVYPNFAKICHDTLENEEVEIACVSACFPSSQSFIEVKVAETALALKDGATEIDIVIPVGKFLAGDYEGMCDEISEIKSVCGDKKLKTILETGCLKTGRNIKIASILAMYSGADYIKTSTGKLEPAATPEAAFVMCQAIKEYYEKTGIQIGFKPAGGMKTVEDALTYYTIVKEVLGEKWLTNQYLRLGTSSLANKLLSEIEGKEIMFF